MYTDYYTDVEKQMESGWSFIAIIGLNIMVNTSMMVYTSALMVKNLVKKLRHKYRVWKYKREIQRAEKLYKDGEFDPTLHEDRFVQKVYNNLKAHNRDIQQSQANSTPNGKSY